MRVLVSGSTGFLGSAAVASLAAAGHEVVRLVRARRGGVQPEVVWDPAGGTIDAAAMEGVEAVVHLAGENIAGVWTREKKERIYKSRVESTRLLSGTLARLRPSPRVLVSASAVGYYGDRGDELLDERSPPGPGFMADVCREWEAATAPAGEAGIRVVCLRLGILLDASGGVLASMMRPFGLGLGARLGSGRQWVSWATRDEAVRVIEYALASEGLQGPVNVVAPHPVTNATLSATLAGVLGRPLFLSVPAFVLRAVLRELADMLLSSQRVLPRKLQAAGYEFRNPDLEGALRDLLARGPAPSGAGVEGAGGADGSHG